MASAAALRLHARQGVCVAALAIAVLLVWGGPAAATHPYGEMTTPFAEGWSATTPGILTSSHSVTVVRPPGNGTIGQVRLGCKLLADDLRDSVFTATKVWYPSDAGNTDWTTHTFPEYTCPLTDQGETTYISNVRISGSMGANLGEWWWPSTLAGRQEGHVVPDTTPPAMPAGLVAAAGDTFVDLTWSANTEADFAGYRIWRDGVRVADVTTLTWRDTLLTNGTTYSYEVAALDSAGNISAKAGPVKATPFAGGEGSTTDGCWFLSCIWEWVKQVPAMVGSWFTASATTEAEWERFKSDLGNRAPFSFLAQPLAWADDIANNGCGCVVNGLHQVKVPRGGGLPDVGVSVMAGGNDSTVSGEILGYVRPVLGVLIYGSVLLGLAAWAFRKYAPGGGE